MQHEATPAVNEVGAADAVYADAARKWTRQRVLWQRAWTPKLFSFALTRDADFSFVPGQFARLGVIDSAGEIVARAYSLVARPADDYLEFFSVAVPDGAFTTRVARMQAGDEVLVERNSYGFLTTERFSGGRDLWMLGSGTGIGPYLSILRDGAALSRYENLILVHSVRLASELAYRREIIALTLRSRVAGEMGRVRYVPIVTRESCVGALDQRLTYLINSGRLEESVGLPLDLEHSRLMICGNPEMARELRQHLTARGFRVGRRGEPGQLAFENYW